MTVEACFNLLGLCVVIAPALLFVLFGVTSLVERPLTEYQTRVWTRSAVIFGLVASICILGLMLAVGKRNVPIVVGHWVNIVPEHFHFTIKFVFDRLSVPFVILSFVLCGTIGAFASVYLHREPGFNRFFVCFSMFLLGMIVTSLAGTIETLFAGWELVGLSSAMLVAFFQDRESPVRNGFHVWIVYRVADAALLVAALTLHHLTGQGEFDKLMGIGAWPDGHAVITEQQALFIGLLLLVAAAGKSALAPFSGWLPRAMEGPTPSSAVFYGALSVHLGAFLLMRVSPILELSVWLRLAVVALGVSTATLAAMSMQVQTDIKTKLAFASLIQVGIIVTEIGCGLRYIALAHIIGHACLRTLQLLRAPSLLRDHNSLENALGERLSHEANFADRWVPEKFRLAAYRFAFERGYLDSCLRFYVVEPFRAVFQWCDAAERRWTDFLSGRPSRESDRVPVSLGPEERP